MGGSRKTAPATVHLTSAKLEGHRKRCVYVTCHLSGETIGPVWGQHGQSIRRALAELTRYCDCPAKYHRATQYEGGTG